MWNTSLLQSHELSIMDSWFREDREWTIGSQKTCFWLQSRMNEPCFDILRTKKQLGYSVDCTNFVTYGILGLGISVEYTASKFRWASNASGVWFIIKRLRVTSWIVCETDNYFSLFLLIKQLHFLATHSEIILSKQRFLNYSFNITVYTQVTVVYTFHSNICSGILIGTVRVPVFTQTYCKDQKINIESNKQVILQCPPTSGYFALQSDPLWRCLSWMDYGYLQKIGGAASY